MNEKRSLTQVDLKAKETDVSRPANLTDLVIGAKANAFAKKAVAIWR